MQKIVYYCGGLVYNAPDVQGHSERGNLNQGIKFTLLEARTQLSYCMYTVQGCPSVNAASICSKGSRSGKGAMHKRIYKTRIINLEGIGSTWRPCSLVEWLSEFPDPLAFIYLNTHFPFNNAYRQIKGRVW